MIREGIGILRRMQGEAEDLGGIEPSAFWGLNRTPLGSILQSMSTSTDGLTSAVHIHRYKATNKSSRHTRAFFRCCFVVVDLHKQRLKKT